MSRRCHHGSPRRLRLAPRERRRPAASIERPAGALDPEASTEVGLEAPEARLEASTEVRLETAEPAPPELPAAPPERPAAPRERPAVPRERPAAPLDGQGGPTADAGAPRRIEPAAVGEPEAAPPGPERPDAERPDAERGATAPQLRRFIKSRAYVPMHELRRRFGINGGDDEVTAIDLETERIFVGLPVREGRMLGELLRGGDIGYELSLDPISPVVVGVYPMRPVPRG